MAREYGTKLIVHCPGCGKRRTLVPIRDGWNGKHWAIRQHTRKTATVSERCPGGGTRYRRTDGAVAEVER